MAFAVNENLHEYVPEVFDQGVDDWAPELAKAETDVVNQIKMTWWNKYEDPAQFDKTKLTESQWTKATVYKALYTYILPKLSTFRPEGDPFYNQLEFYKERFAEEFAVQFGVGVDYDHNNDGSVSADEVERLQLNRLYR